MIETNNNINLLLFQPTIPSNRKLSSREQRDCEVIGK